VRHVPSRVAAAAAALLLLLPPAPASAGWGDRLLDKAKEKAKQKTEQAVDETGDAAYDAGKEGVKEGVAPDGEEAAAAGEAPARAAKGTAAAKPSRSAPTTGEAKGAADAAEEVAAGEVYGNRFDFVPGSRVLLFDDFAETGVGDYPARWTVKDGGGGNAAEVVTYKGRKWFKAVASADGVNEPSMHWLRFAPKDDLPAKFTIELDADMTAPFTVVFNKQHAWGGRELRFAGDEVRSENVGAPVTPPGKVVKRISISVNGTYVKAYVGGTRVLQDPEGVERPIARLGFRFDHLDGRGDRDLLEHQMFTGFRLAEGGKDLAQALEAEGKLVVHGISFDSGADVIRPESGGALRAVLAVLEKDAALRFRVEGHTDDQGGPKVNGPLSERRAAAVKAWLVGQGIDASRLEPKGLGATKPMDTNATQEGRANNRRVEFVKLPATS
jgi:outer membrane protein OmpA-like peptidoglycan-associated protein